MAGYDDSVRSPRSPRRQHEGLPGRRRRRSACAGSKGSINGRTRAGKAACGRFRARPKPGPTATVIASDDRGRSHEGRQFRLAGLSQSRFASPDQSDGHGGDRRATACIAPVRRRLSATLRTRSRWSERSPSSWAWRRRFCSRPDGPPVWRHPRPGAITDHIVMDALSHACLQEGAQRRDAQRAI